ncbi:hypothetical protein LJB42_002563 [Komagataella kurtzmanii]|nr:hypothetical protein LJB42_002563 [Komagataella kurtzmanii]
MESKYAEKYQDRLILGDDGDDDELFDELEKDIEDQFLAKYRAERIQQLKQEITKIKDHSSNINLNDHGNMKTIDTEDELLKETVDNERVVIHFFNPSFSTCRIMDEKLSIISTKHIGTRFFRIEAHRAPFLVAKLGIKVLPCVVLYYKGLERDRIVGFDRLSNSQTNFELEALEELLLDSGIVERRTVDFSNLRNKVQNKVDQSKSDSESDLDM